MDGGKRTCPFSIIMVGMYPSAYRRRDLLSGPFVGSEAVSCGLLSREQLRSGAYRRLYRDVYVCAEIPDSQELRVKAACLIVPPGAVLSGRTAAWVHGVDVRRADEPVEITVPPKMSIWPRAGLAIRHARIEPDDVTVVDSAAVTSPLRTGFDLARRKGLVGAVIASDALTNAGLFTPQQLLTYARSPRFKGWRGIRQVPKVVEHTEPKTESPGETRLRLIIVLAGLPRPEAQIDVFDPYGRHCGRVDLGYREARLGIEYDGQQHREQWGKDVERQNRLLAAGWSLLRFRKEDLERGPSAILPRIEHALSRRNTG